MQEDEQEEHRRKTRNSRGYRRASNTPLTPYMRMALPIMFIIVVMSEANIDIFELPMARKSAAQQLYIARNGNDSADIQKYVNADCITPSSSVLKKSLSS